MPESDYDNAFNDSEMDDLSVCRRGRLRSSGWLGEGRLHSEFDDVEMETDPTLPSTEDVIRKTEQITKNIQELLRAAQESKHERSESEDEQITEIHMELLLLQIRPCTNRFVIKSERSRFCAFIIELYRTAILASVA